MTIHLVFMDYKTETTGEEKLSTFISCKTVNLMNYKGDNNGLARDAEWCNSSTDISGLTNSCLVALSPLNRREAVPRYT